MDTRIPMAFDPKRFWSKVQRTGGCWLWIGSTRGGYGLFRFAEQVVSAHRFAWERYRGAIPEGAIVCHRCDNPRCVRLGHLFLGTRAENNADRDRKGRQRSVRGEVHHRAKLTEKAVVKLRKLHAQGIDAKALSIRFGVGHTTAHRAATGRNWSHL